MADKRSGPIAARVYDALRSRYWETRERWPEVSQRYSMSALRDRLGALVAGWRHDCVVVDGVKLRFGRHLSQSMREILYSGKYELAERRIVAKCLESSDTVLEIGTGLGLLAVLCAKRVGSERVVTVEANPALIPVIRETFELNGVRPELKNCVLGKGHGELVFYVMKDFWSSSTVKRSDSATPVMVAQQDFADLLATVRPTFLIIDIEGGEYDLLKDMELPFVRKIAIELHERVIGRDKTTSVLESLARQGFLAVDHLCFGREQLYLERTTDAKTTA